MAIKDEIILLLGIIMVTSSSFIVLGAIHDGEAVNRTALAFSRVFFTGLISYFLLQKFWSHKIPSANNPFDRYPVLIVSIAGVSLAFHFVWFFVSLDYLPVGVSLSLTNTSPIWMLLLSILLLGEKPKFIDWVTILLAIFGIAILGSKDFQSVGNLSNYSLGVLYALLSGIVLAIYLILARWGVKAIGLWKYFGLVNLSSAGSLFLYLLLTEQISEINNSVILFGLLLAIFPGLMGHAAFQYSMSRLPTPLVGAATIGEPLLGTLLAFTFLDQNLQFLDIIGIGITMIALFATVFVNSTSDP